MRDSTRTSGLPQYWIDVGGTFTDCIAYWPDGSLKLHKLLSNGVYRGRVGKGSTPLQIVDPERVIDPPNFFRGYRLTIPARQAGQTMAEGIVESFDPAHGRILLRTPLQINVEPGRVYELSSGQPAPIVGIRWLSSLGLENRIGPAIVRLGTTRGTNSLLEKKGARTVLAITAGFEDILEINDQTRPRLFDLNIRKPRSLCEQSIKIPERIDAKGHVLTPLDRNAARHALEGAKIRGMQALAICLVNGYRNPQHERALREIAREAGFSHVSVSSELAPLQGLLARAETTVIDAYLSPVIGDYIAEIRSYLPDAEISLMTSTGSLVEAHRFVARDSILSGPAAGVVGCVAAGEQAGIYKVIGFDMGGTSTDVSRYDGEYERRYEMQIVDRETDGTYRIVAPMLAIETVAAGGGSICDFDGIKPIVGPASAGADPGPACYGRGGPFCVTDANLFLGRISQANFPFPLDLEAVASSLDELRARIREATGKDYPRTTLAEGYIAIANLHMAASVRKASIQRGHNPSEYTLVAFGGAGGQHACGVASLLGIRRILLPRAAGVLSAHGIGMADVTRFAATDVKQPLTEKVLDVLNEWFTGMSEELAIELHGGGFTDTFISPLRRLLDLRFTGQDAVISVPEPPDGDWRAAFESMHMRLYGFVLARDVEISAARAERTGRTPKSPLQLSSLSNLGDLPVSASVVFNGVSQTVPIADRSASKNGTKVRGPALLLEETNTCVIEPDWVMNWTDDGDLLLERDPPEEAESLLSGSQTNDHASPDPITLELFNNQFAHVAEQMGVTLERTALSTNVKDRRDFSCAIYDATGDLVAHAPHIPVHLGAMGMCVRCLLEDIAAGGDALALRPGAVYVTNDPYRGGSHLPDVTVVTPIFDEQERRVLFFAASRAHHAEIGGIVPGSMPPQSRCLAEEGVLIRAMRLLTCGDHPGQPARVDDDALRRVLTSGPYASRAIELNIADIHAQIAANHAGARGLLAMMRTGGSEKVLAYMRHSQVAARQKMIAALARLPQGRHEFVDQLDDGSLISVTINIADGEASVDLSGTGPVHPGNLNATPAIVSSAVLYCFRCLIDEDIPLNAGVLAPIRIHVPPGLLNPQPDSDPMRCPAVAGGNVETSQRIVDVIFGALGLVAASQGTMNNLSFGNESFGYYETIAGGAGAGPGFNGASGVHCHMTNTRLTDTEVMEDRFPVRVRRLSLRRNSGGAGHWQGGDGIIRELEFLAPLDASLVTQRRVRAPYGSAGGGDGMTGINRLARANREPNVPDEILPGISSLRVDSGDRLIIETPGGGGYGHADTSDADRTLARDRKGR